EPWYDNNDRNDQSPQYLRVDPSDHPTGLVPPPLDGSSGSRSVSGSGDLLGDGALALHTDHGSEVLVIPNPALLPTVLQAVDESDFVGLDLETTGLNPRTDRARLLSLATARGLFVLDCFAVDPAPLFAVLAEKTLVGQNLLFDLSF